VIVVVIIGIHLYFKVARRDKDRWLEPKNLGVCSLLRVGAREFREVYFLQVVS
jgi:hypothetical protein